MTVFKIAADKGRENDTIEALKKISKYDIVDQQINVGDFAIMRKKELLVIIERKTWRDLAATIRDATRKANHQKLLDAREMSGCDIVYIVEGQAFPKYNGKIARMPCNCLYAFLDHIMLRDKCMVVQTYNTDATAERIVHMVDHYATIKSKPYKIVEADEEPARAEVRDSAVVGGNSDDDTKSVMKILKQKKIISNDVIKKRIWEILGINSNIEHILKIADFIADKYNADDIAQIKRPSGRAIGSARANNIIMRNDISYHTKILSTIPRVSKKTATYLLNQYSLLDIINMDTEELSKVPRKKDGKCLGKLATDIHAIFRD